MATVTNQSSYKTFLIQLKKFRYISYSFELHFSIINCFSSYLNDYENNIHIIINNDHSHIIFYNYSIFWVYIDEKVCHNVLFKAP